MESSKSILSKILRKSHTFERLYDIFPLYPKKMKKAGRFCDPVDFMKLFSLLVLRRKTAGTARVVA